MGVQEDNGNHALNFNAIDTWNGDYVYLGSILDFGTNFFLFNGSKSKTNTFRWLQV